MAYMPAFNRLPPPGHFYQAIGERSLKDSKKFLLDLIKGSDDEKLALASKIVKAVFL